MTATEIFVLFLKTELTVDEYLYFMPILSARRRKGRAKPLLHKRSVENYLKEHRRTLYGYMTRVFKLCPNLINYAPNTKLYQLYYKRAKKMHRAYEDDYEYLVTTHANCLFVRYYANKWHYFLTTKIVGGKGSYNSPFEKNSEFDFKLKTTK